MLWCWHKNIPFANETQPIWDRDSESESEADSYSRLDPEPGQHPLPQSELNTPLDGDSENSVEHNYITVSEADPQPEARPIARDPETSSEQGGPR